MVKLKKLHCKTLVLGMVLLLVLRVLEVEMVVKRKNVKVLVLMEKKFHLLRNLLQHVLLICNLFGNIWMTKIKKMGHHNQFMFLAALYVLLVGKLFVFFFLNFVQVQSDNLQMRQNHKAIPPIPVDNVRERMVQVERMDISVESKNGKDDIEMAPAGADVRKSVCCGDCEHGDWFLIVLGRKFHGRYWR